MYAGAVWRLFYLEWMMQTRKVLLWDIPLRLFHWLLVVSVVAAVITGEKGGNLIVWHGRLGLLIIGLLAFRLVWGLIGSTYARFAQFFPTPSSIKSYFQGKWHGIGHNPLGALSVFALLGLLTAQATTGLFSNDDIAFHGPLMSLLGGEWSVTLTHWHHKIKKLIILMVLLHIGAIVFYVRFKKKNLVVPMVTGYIEADNNAQGAKTAGLVRLLLALVVAGAAVYGASGIWIPELPPAPAVETPSW